MTNKDFELPDNPQSLERIATAIGPIQTDQMLYLVKNGIDPHTVMDIIATNGNLMKWFAVNYHRLMLEGKIPENMQYQPESEFTHDIDNQLLHRRLDEIIGNDK